MKAANFFAKLVKIGLWQIESKIEGDLVAKCYYAKKKLVWEYLDKSIRLKKKIEIQWSDISAIRAIIHEDEHGILDIELNNPPTFHDEDDPQPRKHTCWKPTRDFTNGQGSIYRRHRLVFPPGCLDKHYEKLLSCDERLFELSQKPFPSSNSPYFRSNSLRQSSLFENNNAYGGEMKHGSQFSLLYGSLPVLAPLQTPTYGQQTFQPFSASKETTTSPVSVIEYQHVDEGGTSFVNNPLTTYFDPQGMTSYGNNLPQNQVQALMYQANNPVAYHQNVNISTPQSELITLSSLEDHFLNDSLVMDNDERSLLPRVDSLNALSREHVVPEQSDISNFDWRVLSPPIRSNESEQLLYQQHQQQFHYPSQIPPNENLAMHHLVSNNSIYQQHPSQPPASVPDSSMQDSSALNTRNEINGWDAFPGRRH
ncbi:uncharacterized protein LOC120009862 isoform X2 [Tripterygium wilfordii]|nr:uncharacterized protein LOC120009862 isoform X2 [Tripterygium wilfordii]